MELITEKELWDNLQTAVREYNDNIKGAKDQLGFAVSGANGLLSATRSAYQAYQDTVGGLARLVAIAAGAIPDQEEDY